MSDQNAIRTCPESCDQSGAGRNLVRSRYISNDEPPLDELLADPILHLLLRRDDIRMVALRRVIHEARRILAPDGRWPEAFQSEQA